jgi:hypothetical protein
LKQINDLELQFLLAPNGRAMVEQAAPGQTTAPALGALSRFRS